MTVEADIISGKRSLLQYLLKPIYRGIDVGFSER
jgi:adhesin transport system membrane fusion protein